MCKVDSWVDENIEEIYNNFMEDGSNEKEIETHFKKMETK